MLLWVLFTNSDPAILRLPQPTNEPSPPTEPVSATVQQRLLRDGVYVKWVEQLHVPSDVVRVIVDFVVGDEIHVSDDMVDFSYTN